jgi:phosphate acetyltransferase
MDLLDFIKQNAQKKPRRIVLAEGTEPRTLEAANIALYEGLAKVILVGNKEEIAALAGEKRLDHIDKASIVDPPHFDKVDEYADVLVQLRKHKG